MKKILPLLFIILLMSCEHKIVTRNNNPNDIKDAEKELSKVYELIAAGDTLNLKNRFKDGKWADFKKILEKTKTLNGEILKVQNSRIQTVVKKNNEEKPFKRYEYEVNVTYEKGKTIETIGLESYNDIMYIDSFWFKLQ
ncbi:hypothetical protein [Flavobacterium pedocola]